jgi:hypothetical protein
MPHEPDFSFGLVLVGFGRTCHLRSEWFLLPLKIYDIVKVAMSLAH